MSLIDHPLVTKHEVRLGPTERIDNKAHGIRCVIVVRVNQADNSAAAMIYSFIHRIVDAMVGFTFPKG